MAQSASPRIHRYWARQYNKRITYRAIEARRKKFTITAHEFFRAGGRGLNVTAPHKEVALRMAQDVSERARACGAANLLEMRKGMRLFADNVDGAGLVRDLTVNLGADLHGKRIAVIGAGGAARGILLPLLELGPARLLLTNRTEKRAREIARDLSPGGDIEAGGFRALAGGQFDLVINATSAGLKGRIPTIPTEIMIRDALCYDLAYGPAARPFMKYAQRKGAAVTADGWGMLVEQAAESFLVWFKVRPDTDYVLHTREKFIPKRTGS